jgi:hypothetical protein
MDVIAVLHTQLNAANEELESFRRNTDELTLRLQAANEAAELRATLLQTTADDVEERKSLLTNAQGSYLVSSSELEMKRSESVFLRNLRDSILPQTAAYLDDLSTKRMKVRAFIGQTIKECNHSEKWSEGIVDLQARIECRRGVRKTKPSEDTGSTFLDEQTFLRLLSEEEKAIDLGMVGMLGVNLTNICIIGCVHAHSYQGDRCLGIKNCQL